MSMLDNAVTSIQLGVEDFHDSDPRRMLSALRNLYAGLLLLFKCKLQQLSQPGTNEALLNASVKPVLDPNTGQVLWVSAGKKKKTVEVADLISRLDSLGVKDVDWGLLENLQRIRNDAEHYFTAVSASQMKEAIANSLRLIVQFCRPHLGADPRGLLGDECWQSLVDVEQVYADELAACRKSMDEVDWPFTQVSDSIDEVRCPSCDSQLVRVENPNETDPNQLRFMCTQCGTGHSYEDVLAPAISEHFSSWNHYDIKDGGDGFTQECPNCGNDTFLLEIGECAICFTELEYTECVVCEEPLGVDDQQFRGFCSYHHHVFNKDD
ncbi:MULTISPECIES: hypothetical protein [unclassified Pseudomonas]|uniref:hypothetical protein n=1 Tax=unclassified Pseudomonas TaxID=196821 RepID=UPI0006D3F90C|nr:MULTISPECIES: hypothetical protein [unclassified Pseudomonas]